MEVSLLCRFFKYSKASKLKQHSKFSMDLKLRTWRCAYDKQFCVGLLNYLVNQVAQVQ